MTRQQPALRRQIIDLEIQVVQRRENLRSQFSCFRQKVSRQSVTPGLLLAAVGAGVALEQCNHQKTWSLASLLNAVSAGMGLVQSFRTTDSVSS